MREADFGVLLRLVERLGGEQRAALGRALASAPGEPEAVRLLEEAFAAAPRCPHCGERRPPQRWGHASGLRRYRCTACRKTFNALTGTSLARLRKKACWLRYGEALAAGMSLTKAAAHCGVHRRPASAGGTASCGRRRRRARPWAAWSRRTRPSFAAPTRAPAGGGAPTPRPNGARAGAASGRASGPLGRAGPGPDRPRPRRPHRRRRAARPGRRRHRRGARARGRRRRRALLGRRQGLRRLRRRARASATSRSTSRPASGSATAPSTSRT